MSNPIPLIFRNRKKHNCPICGTRFHKKGFRQHWDAKHPYQGIDVDGTIYGFLSNRDWITRNE